MKTGVEPGASDFPHQQISVVAVDQIYRKW